MKKPLCALAACLLTACLLASPAIAQTFDWKAHQGETLDFLTENQPWSNAVVAAIPEFEKLTGIKVQVDTFQEQQMRQRLATILQAKSASVDTFMSLKSLEGQLYANAGWYADLGALMKPASATDPAYDFADFSPALVRGETFNGKLDGIPLNIEGPIVYYREDVLQKCNIQPPTSLDALQQAAAAIKKCDATIIPWATRGLKAALPYTFSNVLHNFGADYTDASGKPALCTPEGEQAITWYATMMKDDGPPGGINNSFLQTTEIYGQGRAAMAFESSNEFADITKFAHRQDDTGVMLLPPGPGGSHPTVIGWGLSISAYSKKQDAAWYFVQWATTKQMDAKLALQGIAPPRNSVADSPDYKAWLDQVPVRRDWAALLNQMGPNGTSEVGPPVERQPQARDIVGDAVDSVILGRASAHDAACAADRQLAALMGEK